MTDWRDGVERLEATSAPRDLQPLLDAMEPGQRLALVVPTIYVDRPLERAVDVARAAAVGGVAAVRSPTIRGSASPRSSRPSPFPPSPNPVRAQVYLKR